MKTSKDFYRHSDTGEIFAIERRWDGAMLRSCGPLKEESLRALESYDYTDKLNLWLQEVSDKLILFEK